MPVLVFPYIVTVLCFIHYFQDHNIFFLDLFQQVIIIYYIILYIVAFLYSLNPDLKPFIYYLESYFLSHFLTSVVLLFTVMAPTAEEIVKLDTRGLFCSMNIRSELCIFCGYFLNFLLLYIFYRCLIFFLFLKIFSLGMLIVHLLLSFKKNLVKSGPLQIAQGMYI